MFRNSPPAGRDGDREGGFYIYVIGFETISTKIAKKTVCVCGGVCVCVTIGVNSVNQSSDPKQENNAHFNVCHSAVGGSAVKYYPSADG